MNQTALDLCHFSNESIAKQEFLNPAEKLIIYTHALDYLIR